MSKLYSLKDKDAKNVVVEGIREEGFPEGFVNIVKIMGSSELLGENFNFPIPKGLAFIHENNMTELNNDVTNSFFGRPVMTTTYSMWNMQVVVTEYKSSVSVSVLSLRDFESKDSTRTVTLYSQNFFDNINKINEVIVNEAKTKKHFDDLIFILKSMKDQELGTSVSHR